MPKPVAPAPGDPISSAWAGEIIDFAGEKWEWHPIDTLAHGWIVNGVKPNSTAIQVAECLDLPANDPKIVAVDLIAMIRHDTGGNNLGLIMYDFDDEAVSGQAYTSGIAGRGGMSGPYLTKVGGLNNRQIKWSESGTGPDYPAWLIAYGYWTRETIVP